MTIPKKVAEQGRKADEELERLKKEREGADSPEGNTGINPDNSDPPTDTGTDPDEGKPADQDGDGKKEGDQGYQTDWEAEAKAAQRDAEGWRQRYETLKGKYDSEVPKLHDRVDALEARLMSGAPPTEGGPAATPTANQADGLDPQNLEEVRDMYGENVVNLILSASAKAKADAMREVDRRFERVENIERSTREERFQRLENEIAKSHPDWTEIDKLSTFRAFLDETDQSTGLPRGVAVQAAYKRCDAGPIVHAITEFKRRSNRKGRGLENQVVPDDSGRTDKPQRSDEKTYKSKDVKDFYDRAAKDLANGKMSREEYDRLDALYQKAGVEGRIT